MKNAIYCVLVLAICLFVGCGENREESAVLSSEDIWTVEPSEDYYIAATSLSAKEVEAFAMDVKKNILEGDWAALSERISYPITISGVAVDDASDFLKMEIDIRMNPDFVDAMEAETCQQMFCNWQGISMGESGQIWIGSILDENGNSELKIIGINGMMTEGEANGELLERFYEQVYGDDLSFENMEGRLADRGGCYHESSYYDEITYYWEIIRGVTDTSNLTDPLYFTDMKYYTAEDFANDTPVAIHLAKNEIYAKRGYIFQNEDLNHYFLGCAWYTPLYTVEEFDTSVFNDFERKNLELLAELDANFNPTDFEDNSNDTFQEKLTVEEAWKLLKENYTHLRDAELEEISYDDNGNMQIVIGRGYWPWSDEEVDRYCESLVFFDTEEDSCYLFGHHYVYYEEDEEIVFATQTKGWFEVDFYTGEVSRW
uniref:YARHG domain-containing protein n=1 Tax=Acetatifactor sp. TaxID=1872090 RepID=UPI00405705A1